jgi:ATP adenylyltransferase
LKALVTEIELLPGVFGAARPPFILRVLPPADPGCKKPEPPKPTWHEPKERSPFLCPDPELVVLASCGAQACHRLLFNKFPVVDKHLLLCTREFRYQDEDLDEADVVTMRNVALYAFPTTGALCFFNCGRESGASQGHKHVQIVPLLVTTLPGMSQRYPIDVLAEETPLGADRIAEFPFVHAFQKLSGSDSWFSVYRGLLAKCALDQPERRQSYTFICTTSWMLVVPRSCEGPRLPDGSLLTSVNALGFAGSVLAKNASVASKVKEMGPLQVLSACCQPMP